MENALSFLIHGMLIFGAALLVLAVVILCTRITGLRSFSKMSSFDFAMTIAVGSVIATGVVGPDPAVLEAGLALIALFIAQMLVSLVRRKNWAEKIIDNEPMLLMLEGEILHENMRRCRVTVDDLRAKLREANVLRQSEIRAVVLETTGDISVLHGVPLAENGAPLEAWLIETVRGYAPRNLPNHAAVTQSVD